MELFGTRAWVWRIKRCIPQPAPADCSSASGDYAPGWRWSCRDAFVEPTSRSTRNGRRSVESDTGIWREAAYAMYYINAREVADRHYFRVIKADYGKRNA